MKTKNAQRGPCQPTHNEASDAQITPKNRTPIGTLHAALIRGTCRCKRERFAVQTSQGRTLDVFDTHAEAKAEADRINRLQLADLFAWVERTTRTADDLHPSTHI